MKESHKKILLVFTILLFLFPSIFLFEGIIHLIIDKIFNIREELSKNLSTVIFLIFNILSSVAVVSLYLKLIHKTSIKNIGFNLKNRSHDLFLGLALGFILIAIGFLGLILSKNIDIADINFNLKSVFFGFIIMILVSIHEEIITRGYLLNTLNQNSNRIIALLLSSSYFALMHIFNSNIDIIPLINIFLAGILLGVPYIYTKNLAFPLAFHFSWNFFQGPIFGFEVSGNEANSVIEQSRNGSKLITGGEFGFEGSIIASILLVISIYALYYFYNEQNKLKQKISIDFSDNQLYINDESE